MKVTRRGILLGPLLAVAGCVSFGADSPPTTFYLLSSLASQDPEAMTGASGEGVALGVGPVEIPPYLNRPQIVTRSEGNRLELAEFHKWVEPLRWNVARVLASNLSVLLGTERVSVYPWPRSAAIEYRVRFDVMRFSADPDGTVVLSCRWTLADPAGAPLDSRVSRFDVPAQRGDFDAIVAAMSRSLADLAREVAAAIREQGAAGRVQSGA